MAYDSGKRLLLYVLVKGLGEAVRRNDQSAARRYLVGDRDEPKQQMLELIERVIDLLPS